MALIERLKLGERPVGVNAEGALVFEANIENKTYILWDSNRDAPPGFEVRVAGKTAYIIRRTVDGVSLMHTMGNVGDFLDLQLERKKRRGALSIACGVCFGCLWPRRRDENGRI